jgi:hypothetical protein
VQDVQDVANEPQYWKYQSDDPYPGITKVIESGFRDPIWDMKDRNETLPQCLGFGALCTPVTPSPPSETSISPEYTESDECCEQMECCLDNLDKSQLAHTYIHSCHYICDDTQL